MNFMKKKIILIMIFSLVYQQLASSQVNWKIEFIGNVKAHYYYGFDYSLIPNPISLGCPPSEDYGYRRNPQELQSQSKIMENLWDFLDKKRNEENSIIMSLNPPEKGKEGSMPALIEITFKNKEINAEGSEKILKEYSKAIYDGVYLEYTFELNKDRFIDDYRFNGIINLDNNSDLNRGLVNLNDLIKGFIKDNYNEITKNKCPQYIDIDAFKAFSEITSDNIRLIDNSNNNLICEGGECRNIIRDYYPWSRYNPWSDKIDHVYIEGDDILVFYQNRSKFLIGKNSENLLMKDNISKIIFLCQVDRNLENMKLELNEMKIERDGLYNRILSLTLDELSDKFKNNSSKLLKMEDFLNGSEAFLERDYDKGFTWTFDDKVTYYDISSDIKVLKSEVFAMEKHYEFIKDLYFAKTNEAALNRSTYAIIIAIAVGAITTFINVYYWRKSIRESKNQSQKLEEMNQKVAAQSEIFRKEDKNQSKTLYEIREGIEKLVENARRLSLRMQRGAFKESAKPSPITKKEKEKALKSLAKKKGLKL